jgi:hypothetical protein
MPPPKNFHIAAKCKMPVFFLFLFLIVSLAFAATQLIYIISSADWARGI